MKFLKKPIPYEEESLSSYLTRLSISNAASLEWILSEWGIKSEDKFDSIMDTELLENIAQSLEMGISTIKNMTLVWQHLFGQKF